MIRQSRHEDSATPRPGTPPSADAASGAGLPRRTLLRATAVAGTATGLVVAAGESAVAATGGSAAAVEEQPQPGPATLDGPPLLCEPYLLDPDRAGVRVVWHTEDRGGRQVVVAGTAVAAMTDQQVLDAATGACDRSAADDGSGWRRFLAGSLRLERMREDTASLVPGRTYTEVTDREVWRHLAEVRDLRPGRTPYRVVSIDSAFRATLTGVYTLAAALPAGSPARLLLTSDHQLKTMTPANLEMVAQTAGVQLDGVLMAGDCVNVPDRASDWFDSTTGLAFFANLTGRATKTIAGRTYTGAPVLQHTPIYPTIGNHEVMGRWSATDPLTTQFNNPQPTEVAARLWDQTQPAGVDRATWMKQHSWDVSSYEQVFPYPRSAEGGPRWYSRTIGDVFLVSLFVTGIWRPAAAIGKGKFQERADALGDPEAWGFGQFIFEPISRGSRQYAWLERTLRSRAARAARYRVVMYHHPSHGLGDNSAPALTDPVQAVTIDPATGKLTGVTYSYPLGADHVLRDVEPLLTGAGVNLVLNGHSHLWNRFRNAAGVNWLETSNVGNTYGAFDASNGASRALPAVPDHVLQGDPGRLAPQVPTLAPLAGADGRALPYLSSSDITVFSILDSGAGTVRSYRFDTRTPQVAPVLFDEFPLA